MLVFCITKNKELFGNSSVPLPEGENMETRYVAQLMGSCWPVGCSAGFDNPETIKQWCNSIDFADRCIVYNDTGKVSAVLLRGFSNWFVAEGAL